MDKKVRFGRRILYIMMLVLLGTGCVSAAGTADITQSDIDAGIAFCKEYPVTLQVDGKTVQAEVPPIIVKEKTLIPARAVFENMGATVTWDEGARLVEVTLGSSNVKLTIDSKTAFVGGVQKTMDVPAMIINDKTLIPVRFVAESLACAVNWDDAKRIVKISSPEVKTTTPITSITVEEQADFYRIVVQGEGIIEGYKTSAYDNPDRFGIDMKGVTLNIENSGIDSKNEIFSAIRYSQFDSETVRLVVDLEEKVVGKVTLSSDKQSLFIDFSKKQNSIPSNPGGVTSYGHEYVDWRASGKLVVIDPGHGGKDTGSQGKENGVEILNEKDINLDVALRLNSMLKEAGVSTYILRETDKTITLYDRPALANAANGDLYISVHNNSSEGSSANGVEVYYNSKSNESDYGIYSKHLAEVAQTELVKALGIRDRGAKSEPAYAVLNKTQMPAIIIEGAFLSNPDNLKLMLTDEFREKYAYAAAKAIIQILNESVSE